MNEKEILVKILSGRTRVDGETIRSKTQMVRRAGNLEFKQERPFVSRGGEKLEGILAKWNIPVKDKVYLDAGCSTGGFTDCLLKRGASLVYAVDVGFNQLDYSLRVHPRVRPHEQTNIKEVTPAFFDPLPDSAVCDLSFRSIKGVASHILTLIKEDSFITLVKPQFEYENPDDSFDGIIRDRETLYGITSDLIDRLAEEQVYIIRLDLSPIKGRKGNIEFFFQVSRTFSREAHELKEDLKKVLDGANL